MWVRGVRSLRLWKGGLSVPWFRRPWTRGRRIIARENDAGYDGVTGNAVQRVRMIKTGDKLWQGEVAHATSIGEKESATYLVATICINRCIVHLSILFFFFSFLEWFLLEIGSVCVDGSSERCAKINKVNYWRYECRFQAFILLFNRVKRSGLN